MKKLILPLLVFAALPLSSSSGAPDASAEIRAVIDAQVAAWNRGDIDGFMAGYVRSDKLEFVSGGKITRGWQTVRDRYHRKYDSRAKMGRLKFSDVKITMLTRNIALVLGRWEITRDKDRPQGSFTLTFRHQPEGWRIVHDSTDSSS
jgi:ketosteroid isomerase-like protein